jgi:cell division inhibitor SepF
MSNPLRKSMVWLGLADDQFDYDEAAETAAPAPVPLVSRAPVTPLPKRQPARMQVVPEMNEILTVHPRQYRDAQGIADSFRDGVPVIINLTEMDEGDARRLVDFAAGLAFGLRGTIERVTNRVFLLSPANVQVTAEDKAKIAEGGFFTQS